MSPERDNRCANQNWLPFWSTRVIDNILVRDICAFWTMFRIDSVDLLCVLSNKMILCVTNGKHEMYISNTGARSRACSHSWNDWKRKINESVTLASNHNEKHIAKAYRLNYRSIRFSDCYTCRSYWLITTLACPFISQFDFSHFLSFLHFLRPNGRFTVVYL